MSLIEVMIAFAVTSILVAFTLPSYFDQVLKERVDKGMSQIGEAQSALAATCESDASAIVTDNQDAGFLYLPDKSKNGYIREMLLAADCAEKTMVIVVWINHLGDGIDPILEWSANGSGNEASWTCRLVRGEMHQVPGFCSNHQQI